MSRRKKISPSDLERQLIADAHDPDAWVAVTAVPPARSPRPSWYNRRSRPSSDSQFRSLYTSFYPRLVRFFVQTFRTSPEEATELAQDVFMRFYSAMGEYRGDAQGALLETMARNIAHNRMRAHKGHKRAAGIIDIDEARRKLAAPPRQEEALRLKEMYDAMGKLRPEQRDCLQLWLDGFSYSEISSLMHIRVDTVRARLREAQEHLRSRLNSEEINPIQRRRSS